VDWDVDSDVGEDGSGRQIRHVAAPVDEEFGDPDPENEREFDPLRHNGATAIKLGTDWQKATAGAGDSVGNAFRIALGAYDYLLESIGFDAEATFLRWRSTPRSIAPII
jgi:hypothetical protein